MAEIFSDPMMIMLLLGTVIAVMAIATPFVLITLAAFIYVWINMYPWLKMVGKWGARPANFVALVVFFYLCVFFYLVLAFLIHPLFLVFILPALIILFPVYLAVFVFIVRIIKWVFFKLSGFLDGIFLAVRLEFIKFKIKTDMFKEGGAKGKFGAFKGEFSGDARRVTGKVSGKKETGFRSKLEALKGEFSSDVERARSKLSRRK